MDLLPIVSDGAFVGVVTTSEILELDDILGQASNALDGRTPSGGSQ